MPLTWVEINKKNILHNIRQFKNIAPKSEIWPVLKSNAYGHGLVEIADFLKDNEDIAGFMLASLDEALSIKDKTTKPLMVLSYFDRDDFKLLKKVEKQISLPLYDLETADYLDSLGKKIFVNIKIDTGTSRLGFRLDEAKEAIKYVEAKDNLEIYSIFTHYAQSEAEDLSFSKEQFTEFSKITKDFSKYKTHSACSAASIALPEAQADIIRLGLSFYGLWPSEATKRRAWMSQICLQPLLTWKTKVIQVKNLKAGDTIGYNRTYKCPKDCQIAVLPIGYNEGYDRLLSNKAEVIIKGQKCKVRGNICMNLTMVEIPEGLNLEVGEVVTLLGQQDGQSVSADDLAKHAQTINYEIVTRINPSIKRILV